MIYRPQFFKKVFLCADFYIKKICNEIVHLLCEERHIFVHDLHMKRGLKISRNKKLYESGVVILRTRAVFDTFISLQLLVIPQ